MATIIYPTSASVYTRVIDTTGLSEFHIDIEPNLVFVLTGSFPNTSSVMFIQGYDTGSTFPLSASWALNVVSASLGLTSSYAVSASYASNASNVSILNGTSPTFKQYVTASIANTTLNTADVLTIASISSSNAKVDGADFRVQRANPLDGTPSGSYLPMAVNVVGVTGSITTYNVWWTDTYISNSTNTYIITYGDPYAYPMYLGGNQLTVVKKRGSLMPNGTVVYQDNTQADSYNDSQWGTIGVRQTGFTNADVFAGQFATTTPYQYNGATQLSFSANADGVFRYGNVALNTVNLGSPDQWAIDNSDNRTIWVDMCATVDGWALQYYFMRPYNQATWNAKVVIRYRNNGKFVLSVFDTTPGFQTNVGTMTIQGYAGTTYWAYTNNSVITASIPSTAMAVVIEPYARSAFSQSEQPY